MDPPLPQGSQTLLENYLALIIQVSFLSAFIERSLSVIFELDFLVHRIKGKSIKSVVALAFAYLVVNHWKFDAVSAILGSPKTTVSGDDFYGVLLTAMLVAGGSKASIKFFSRLPRHPKQCSPQSVSSNNICNSTCNSTCPSTSTSWCDLKMEQRSKLTLLLIIQ